MRTKFTTINVPIWCLLVVILIVILTFVQNTDAKSSSIAKSSFEDIDSKSEPTFDATSLQTRKQQLRRRSLQSDTGTCDATNKQCGFGVTLHVDLGDHQGLLDNEENRRLFEIATKDWLNTQSRCDERQDDLYTSVRLAGNSSSVTTAERRRLGRRRSSGKGKGRCRGKKCPNLIAVSFPNARRLQQMKQTPAFQEPQPDDYDPESSKDDTQRDDYDPVADSDDSLSSTTMVPTSPPSATVVPTSPPSTTTLPSATVVPTSPPSTTMVPTSPPTSSPTATPPCDVTIFDALKKVERDDFGSRKKRKVFANIVRLDLNMTDASLKEIEECKEGACLGQRSAVEALYNEFDIEYDKNEFECAWDFLSCDDDERILYIGLYTDYDDYGDAVTTEQRTIPTEVGFLDKMDALKLNGLGASGSIPTELGKIENLIQLDLEYNRLTGSLPTEFGNLERLEFLYIQANRLIGTIPSELLLLDFVDFVAYNNSFAGTIPSEVGSLTNLEIFDIEMNKFEGSIPSEIGSLERLEYLYLGFNGLTGTIPSEVGGMKNIGGLFLQHTNITGTIPSELGLLTSLFDLDLSMNKLTGQIPTEIALLENLEHLNLQGNNFAGDAPKEVCNLAYSNNLDLFDLGCTDGSGTDQDDYDPSENDATEGDNYD